MSKLLEICGKKKLHVAAQKASVSLDDLKAQIEDAPAPRGFINALKDADGPALIAEVKKASPSKGIIRSDFDPVDIARGYERGGASCLSVLTDVPYFQGSDAYFKDVRAAVDLPMLRKDFMIDAYQIYESRAMGADCVLIIMAALEDSQAKDLYDLSSALGMDVLVEVHDANELERSARLDPQMIGVNNRNLKTLSVDLQTSRDLISDFPADCLKVAESGISDPQTISEFYALGYTAFLVGESLMRVDNVEKATRTLLTQSVN